MAQDPGRTLQPVTLQLKFTHQFQFAGYYAAIEQGYYREAGLDVRLQERGMNVNTVDLVLEGKADFGIAASDLVVRYAKGAPVVALAPVFQHSPVILLVRADSGVTSLHELAGRPISIGPHDDELFALFKREGIAAGSLDLREYRLDPSMLLNGEVVAMGAYATNEPYALMQADVPYLTFTPRSGGIDFYGDTLFTSRRLADDRPELVRAFVDASMRGWTYAFAHRNETIDLILSKYNAGRTRDHLEFEGEVTARLAQPEIVEVGYTNPGRWRHIAETYAELGVIGADLDLGPFLFNREPASNLPGILMAFATNILITCAVVAVAVHYYRLHRAVREQKAGLQRALDDIKVLRGIIPVCSYCKKVKNDEGAWQQMESYIRSHSNADFTHGICAECYDKVVGEQGLDKNDAM